MELEKERIEFERLKLDYEQTTKYFHTLADVRFKLLALVPVVAGAAFGLVSKASLEPETVIGISGLGFIVTLGIMFYDQRNTQIYNDMMVRAKMLEALMDFTPFSRQPPSDEEKTCKKQGKSPHFWKFPYTHYCNLVNRTGYRCKRARSFLFSICSGFENDLNEGLKDGGKIPVGLQTEFERKKHPLSSIARVKKPSDEIQHIEKGKEGSWLIYDEKAQKKIYLVKKWKKRKKGSKLDVYMYWEGKHRGGAFLDRPKRSLNLFGFVLMWHDRGLALIYAATLGSWSYLLTTSILELMKICNWVSIIARIAIPLLVAIAIASDLHRFDRATDESSALPEYIENLVKWGSSQN